LDSSYSFILLSIASYIIGDYFMYRANDYAIVAASIGIILSIFAILELHKLFIFFLILNIINLCFLLFLRKKLNVATKKEKEKVKVSDLYPDKRDS
jgi:hypothetical protein